MKKTTKMLASALCIAAIGANAAVFASCGEAETITISGSSPVSPLMEKLAEQLAAI